MSASAMDVDETDQTSVAHQAQNMAYANETYLSTLPEPWKTIAAEAIPSGASKGEYLTVSMRLDQLEMSSRSHILQLLMEEDHAKADKIGPTWRMALDMCHHMVHFACMAKEKQQKESEEQKKEQEGKEESETTAVESSVSSPYLEMEPRKLPLQLLEDCIDGLTLQESESLWMGYVEPSLSTVLLGDLFWKSSKACHLQFLKVCNQVLHRIQGSSAYYEWKGSLLLAQAKAFGIADRSAIKVWGSFRGSTKEIEEDGEEFESFDEFADKLEDPQGEKEYSLYKAFWSLQGDFSNPNSIQIADFIKKMKLVLEAMESVSKNTGSNSKSDPVLPLSGSESYLTSSTLFLTQLEQKEFQSQFLSQFIVVTNHLSAESPSLGNALSSLYQRSKDLLKRASPAVYHLLCDVLLVQSEAHWRRWKKEQRCAASAFATPKRLLETIGVLENGEWEEHSKKRVQLTKEAMKGMPRKSAANKSAARQKKQTEDEAWIQQFAPVSKEEVVVACAKLGSFEPSLEEHMEDFIDAFDPDAGIEEEYHPKNDPEFSWRAMRLFSKHQLPLLKLCRKPKHLEAMARQWHKNTTGKDLPGEMPESEASESEGEEDNKSESGDNPKEEEKKEVEEEEGGGEDVSQDDDGNEDGDAGDKKSTSEDVEMVDKEDAKEEAGTEEIKEDVPLKEDAEEKKDNETSKSTASEQEEKTEGDENATVKEADDTMAAASTETPERQEDVDKKQEADAIEIGTAKDDAKETKVEEGVALTKEEGNGQVKDKASASVEEETKEEKAKDTGDTKESENGDNGSQRGSRNNSIEREDKGNHQGNENDRSNFSGDSNANKRKHHFESSGRDNDLEDYSKRPRGEDGLGRSSRNNSEERQGSRDNNNRGGSRDRYRSNDNRGRRGRSSDDGPRSGRYDDHDQRRRGDNRGGDGRYDERSGSRRDNRYEDGPRGGGRQGDRFNDGRGRRGGDRNEEESTSRVLGEGGGRDRSNDGPPRGGGRRGGGGDRNEEESTSRGHGGGGDERFHGRRGGGDRNDEDTSRGGRREDRFEPRGRRRDDRAEEGHRGGGGGGGRGRGGPRNSGGGDRRYDRRPDDRNRGRRGGGRGGGPRR